ncbi:MAG: hypothetical protein FJY17_01090 [Bacteroidetes bacterium]|nr:hypothetical protein [Bacteroidota bacterium]
MRVQLEFISVIKKSLILDLIKNFKMDNLLCIGQWQGFYSYGPEYGEYVESKEAEFRLFIEEITKDEFSGRVIDWDGFGVDGEISEVKGFISGQLISFIKKYPNCRLMDKFGNVEVVEDMPSIEVLYKGEFDSAKGSFAGKWEISQDVEEEEGLINKYITTGIWRLHRST